MKSELILKILGGIALVSGGISTITVTAIKLSSQTQASQEDTNQQQTVENDINDISSQDDNSGISKTQNDDEAEDNSVISLFAVIRSQSKDITKIDQFEDDYQCKFEGQKAFDCKASIVKLNTNLKHSSISEFMQDDDSKTITKEELKKTSNVFKITLSNNYVSSKINWNVNYFYLIKKEHANKDFVKFDWLFTMKDNKLHKKTRISSFIFKSSIATEGNVNYGFVTTCSTTQVTDANCYVYSFSSNANQDNLKNLSFDALNNAFRIEQDKHYVINFSIHKQTQSITNIEISDSYDEFGKHNVLHFGYFLQNDDFSHFFFLN